MLTKIEENKQETLYNAYINWKCPYCGTKDNKLQLVFPSDVLHKKCFLTECYNCKGIIVLECNGVMLDLQVMMIKPVGEENV